MYNQIFKEYQIETKDNLANEDFSKSNRFEFFPIMIVI